MDDASAPSAAAEAKAQGLAERFTGTLMGHQADADADGDASARLASQIAEGELADADDASVGRRWLDGLELTRGLERPVPLAAPRASAQTPSLASAGNPLGLAPAGQPVGPTGTMSSLGLDMAPAHEVELPQQIIRGIRLQWNQGVSEARLRLQPQNLGEIQVTLRVENGVVRADLQADTAEVRNWIRGHEAELRRTLGEQGLDLERLRVLEDAEQQQRREDGDPTHQHRRAPRRPSADAPRFEVHV